MGNVPRPTLVVPTFMVIFAVLTTGIWTSRHHLQDIEPPHNHDPYANPFGPEFTAPVNNITVAVGRDATFTCPVHHLGGYRVGWVKADTKAIQAIHNHVITHNPRVTVSHADFSTWNLHIHSVQKEDSGEYMCQINTDPMKSQNGYLDVVVPPDFLPEQTSGDTVITEGSNLLLTCKASGRPEPNVTWKREDGAEIIIKGPTGQKTGVLSYAGEVLPLMKVSRTEMGAYLCIASNGVPPTISKRMILSVNFHPVIQVPNQLVGAPLGTDVTLECILEAHPKAISYWLRDNERLIGGADATYGEMVVTSNKHEVTCRPTSPYGISMKVTIRNFQKRDAGSYKCVAKNSLGEVESNIRLYEIPGPTRMYALPIDEEDYNDQFGSAEDAYLVSNNVLERIKDGKTNYKNKTGGNPPKGTAASTQEEEEKKVTSGSSAIYAYLLLPVIVLMFPAM